MMSSYGAVALARDCGLRTRTASAQSANPININTSVCECVTQLWDCLRTKYLDVLYKCMSCPPRVIGENTYKTKLMCTDPVSCKTREEKENSALQPPPATPLRKLSRARHPRIPHHRLQLEHVLLPHPLQVLRAKLLCQTCTSLDILRADKVGRYLDAVRQIAHLSEQRLISDCTFNEMGGWDE